MLEMPELIREWKKVSAAATCPPAAHHLVGVRPQALTSTTGWKAELDQVPQISDLKPGCQAESRPQAILSIDCTNKNVKHHSTKAPGGYTATLHGCDAICLDSAVAPPCVLFR